MLLVCAEHRKYFNTKDVKNAQIMHEAVDHICVAAPVRIWGVGIPWRHDELRAFFTSFVLKFCSC